MKVLIVEDELAIQELIAFVCQTGGYDVLRASSLSQAQPLLSQAPDIVLLDMM